MNDQDKRLADLDDEAEAIGIRLDQAWAKGDEAEAEKALADLFWVDAERISLHRERVSRNYA